MLKAEPAAALEDGMASPVAEMPINDCKANGGTLFTNEVLR